MTPADREKFLEVVVGFAELKGKALSAPALELYWRAMHHWPLEDFLSAAARLIRTCEFMPTPKDFENLRRAGRMTPGEAWARARQVARGLSTHNGHPQDATTDDVVLDAAVRAVGGYVAIAMSSTDSLQFIERRFVQHLEQIRDAEDIREALPQIAAARPPLLTSGRPTRGLVAIGDLIPKEPK